MFLRIVVCGCSNPAQCRAGGPEHLSVALQASVMGLTEHTGLEGHVTVRHVFTGGMQKVNPSSNTPG